MQPIRLFDAIRVQAPYLSDVRAAIDRVLASGRLVLGPEVAAFEHAFAELCGVAHGIGVASGSDALELALRALAVGCGDRVLCVANAGGYASHAIAACGAVPVYVDIDPVNMLMDPAAAEQGLRDKPKALVLTHLYGQLAPVEEIAALCAAHGVALVEDCAQAHGASRNGRRAGSFGDIGCFSFYPTKNLGAMGDGGAVVTHSEERAGCLRELRQYGWRGKYTVARAGGRNSRLDELQAAILNVKLRGLLADNARRRAIAARYSSELRSAAVSMSARGSGEDDVAHLLVLRCTRRDALQAHLARHGIDSDVHYPIPDHWQPAWRRATPPSLPMTEQAASEVLSLPCHPALTDEEVERVIKAVNDFR